MTDQNMNEDRIGPGATGPRDPARLEAAVEALLERHATHQVARENAYADAAIEIAHHRAQRTDASAMALAEAAEHLLCDLDDRSMSNSPEFDAAQTAVQPYVA